ncbi:flagellar filament capping protein FliD [Kyrpidia tusciae]|uniref:Flagellar hook-associated protein 2 n=1 Tax=Kyrpidia tusciae (strain DSM 2912 / NBRC 15312 / T2) TaxID=562970 RepID=D5WUZ6_KYRT2|nr:flagellar filament capping protein FliD [Kyrpidia tusciae]ADG07468.1 flagellar hook-associated 2 domain protein [Kyrpidia tusciae DSM 2912]
MILGATGSTGSSNSFNAIDYSHIAGLASGIDTDSMVKAMMQAESIPLNRLLQQKQIWQWKQDDYRQVNSALLDFRTNALFSMKLQSTFLAKTAGSTNSSAVSASASATATAGTYTVSVNQLATAAYAVSTSSVVAAGKTFDPSQPLLSQSGNLANPVVYDQLGFQETVTVADAGGGNLYAQLTHGIVNPDTFSVNVNGTIYSKSNGNLVVNGTAGAGQIALDTTTGKITFGSSVTVAGNTVTATYDWGYSFSVNGFTANQGGSSAAIDPAKMSLNDIIALVNGSTASGVTVFYDSASGKVSVTTQTTGSNATLNLSGQFLTSVLKLPTSATGQDASFTINGLTTTSHSNSYTLNGVTFQFGATGSATVTVSTDVDSIVKAIEGFVDKYNSLMKTMNDLYHEKRNYDYPPLTDDQKAQMTQDQITKWETMAKSGMLSSDPLLGNVIDSLRGIAGSVLQGQAPSTVNGQTVTLNSLASIGITTGDWWEYGQLHVNEDQLRAAVQADPQAVMRLFTNPTSSLTDTSSPGAGIAAKLYNAVNTAIDQISQEAGSASDLVDNSWIGQQVREIDTRAAEMQQQLDQKRQYYYQQFTAMEQALSQLNSQAGFFQSMMAGH